MNTNARVSCAVLGAGVGLKPEHYDDAVACVEPGVWFEVHPENHLVDGGPRLAWLDAVRAAHPVSLHGVSLSLGGHESPDEAHLKQLRALVRRVEPALVSEHLAWSRLDGVYFPDLLPVVRDRAALDRLAAHIDRAQTVLQRAIAVENPSHYLRTLPHAEEWPETDFLAELSRRTRLRPAARRKQRVRVGQQPRVFGAGLSGMRSRPRRLRKSIWPGIAKIRRSARSCWSTRTTQRSIRGSGHFMSGWSRASAHGRP